MMLIQGVLHERPHQARVALVGHPRQDIVLELLKGPHRLVLEVGQIQIRRIGRANRLEILDVLVAFQHNDVTGRQERRAIRGGRRGGAVKRDIGIPARDGEQGRTGLPSVRGQALRGSRGRRRSGVP